MSIEVKREHEYGSIICWNDRGVEKETIILDSKYHITCAFSERKLQHKDYIIDGFDYMREGNDFLKTPRNKLIPGTYQFTDEELNRKELVHDPKSGTENTLGIIENSLEIKDILDSIREDINLDEKYTISIPNIQTVMRIYAAYNELVKNDPSFTHSFMTKMLWSSTPFNNVMNWCIYREGFVFAELCTEMKGSIVPVIEIK